MKQIQFPLSVVALIAMIFVWKTFVIDRFFPNAFTLPKSNTQTISLTALKVKGEVIVKDGNQRYPLKLGAVISKPVTIYTSSDSLAVIGYGLGFASKIKIDQNTTFDLSKLSNKTFEANDGLYFYIHKGLVLFKIYNPEKTKVLKVKTPTLSMGIRGTTFMVEATDEKSTVLVYEGKVEVVSNKGKPEMAVNGAGFEAEVENELKPVNLKDYTVDWDTESEKQTSTTTSSQNSGSNQQYAVQMSLPDLLEREVKRAQNNFEELKKNITVKRQQIVEKELSLDEENNKISQDNDCLRNLMRNCEFISEQFKNDIANLKNNPVRLTNNPAIKANLEKEFEKALADITKKKSDLMSEKDTMEAEFIVEQSRLGEINSKYEQWKAADEAGKKPLLQDLDKYINSAELHQAIMDAKKDIPAP